MTENTQNVKVVTNNTSNYVKVVTTFPKVVTENTSCKSSDWKSKVVTENAKVLTKNM